MGLLTPLYLLGLAALALPVVFHLLRKSIRKESPFSAMMFLRPSPPKLTRRSRIEHWWLLLLRAAILAFLVFAFTRPLFRSAQTVQRSETIGKEVLVMVDQSASMQRGELWSRAQSKVDELLSNKRTQDRLSLFVYDRTARTVFDATTPVVEALPEETVKKWSSESRPGWQQDDLAASLQAVVDWYRLGASATDPEGEDSTRPAELHVISDFQSPPSAAINQIEWPEAMRVTIHRMEGSNADNASITLLQSSEEQWDANQLNIRVANDKIAQSSRFALVDGREQRLSELVLAPGQSRVVSLAPQADPTIPWRLKLIGDEETFDNVLDLPPVASRQVEVGAVMDAGEGPETSAWMLEQACQSLKFQEVDWSKLDSLEGLVLEEFQALFVLRPLVAAELQSVKAYLQSGGLVITAITEALTTESRSRWESTLQEIGGWQRVSLTEANVQDFVLVSALDTTRPPLQVFRSSTFRDFTSVHVWRYRICSVDDIDTRIIAAFDDGTPFLIHKPLESGDVLVMTAGWLPEESQLGQNSRFATLMIQLAGLRQLRPPVAFAEIGDDVELDSGSADSIVRLLDSEGQEIASSKDASSYRLTAPGLYRLQQDDRLTFVVAQIPNQEREDAQTRPDQLQALGIPGGDVSAADIAQKRQLRLEDEQLESRQQAWRWLIVGVLALLAVETLAGGWLSRNRAVAGAAAE